ncbi:MAG: AAA family ATPase, partial [Nocardioidaceae bacterium]
LAVTLFGDADRMVRLDMSEFGERHTASRLFGAPPGYVGYGDAGELTEAVRRRPYSVVLLDEIEKAHPEVFNTLLQVLDDGRLTDGSGRTVDFTNTVLIMTSNVGSEVISTPSGALGFTSPSQGDDTVSDLRERLMPKLREAFRPEFLNRVDEVVTFGRLSGAELRGITRLLLQETERRLETQQVTAEFGEDAVEWVAEHGHQSEFGARPLRRTIQRAVDDRVADLLLDGSLLPGARVVVGADGGGLTFSVEQPAPA